MNRITYRGVAQIVRFNWPFYVLAPVLIAAMAALLRSDLDMGAWRTGLWVMLILTSWWTTTSLVASHWIYDRSRLYRFHWIRDELGLAPRDWIHLHAGLDESTLGLERSLGRAPLAVFDFFRAEESTEPAIARARRLGREDARTLHVAIDSLPLPDGSCDAAFSVLSAHELRRPAARTALLREVARVLRPGGAVILVEHLRDLPNLIVYGPGFLHFLSRSTWQESATSAGLAITQDLAITPFVHALVLRAAEDRRL